jgi:hypothetical protein
MSVTQTPLSNTRGGLFLRVVGGILERRLAK